MKKLFEGVVSGIVESSKSVQKIWWSRIFICTSIEEYNFSLFWAIQIIYNEYFRIYQLTFLSGIDEELVGTFPFLK